MNFTILSQPVMTYTDNIRGKLNPFTDHSPSKKPDTTDFALHMTLLKLTTNSACVRFRDMKLKKRITRGFIYKLSCFGQAIAGSMSLQTGIKLGRYVAGKAFYLLGKEREKTLRSLQLALGDQKTPPELHKIALASYQNLGKSYFELINFPKLGPKIQDLVEFKGREHLDAALARGKGVLCITAHLGNWELLAAYVASLGYKVNVIARRVNNEKVNETLLDLRSQLGVNTILRESGFSSQRQILRALKNNELLGMLIDQDTKVDGVFVDFFGRPAYTPIGPVSLAMSTGAALIPVFVVRQPDDTHKLTFHPIYELKLTGNKEDDILNNTIKLTNIIEEQIRQIPEQWVWMHQRWKRQPSKHNLTEGGADCPGEKGPGQIQGAIIR